MVTDHPGRLDSWAQDTVPRGAGSLQVLSLQAPEASLPAKPLTGIRREPLECVGTEIGACPGVALGVQPDQGPGGVGKAPKLPGVHSCAARAAQGVF